MGSPEAQAGREATERRHRVRLSQPVDFGRYEITQGQWQRVMGENPSHFSACGPDCPVESVDAFAIAAFLVRLRELTGEAFRLPTEAEWEYACRAGSEAPFGTGATLASAQANYDGRYPYAGTKPGSFVGRTTPVGSYPPSAWGLFDLHGNVWEWCADDLCPYPEEATGAAAIDPLGRCASGLKVIRGGSWTFNGDSARCAVRYSHRPQDSGPSLGLRLVHESR
jgi:formylglycine-generating enzyme required for sulfatase activity